jgi:Tfp pilus assembly protein FimT
MIILILSLAAVGSYASFRKGRRVVLASQTLASTLGAARTYAISTNGWYRVVLQFRNPVDNQVQYAYWIDEIEPNTNTVPNPGTNLVTQNVKRAKITTPEKLTESVEIASAISMTTATVVTAQTGSYAIVRFFQDGSSDMASIRLRDRTGDPSSPSSLSTIKVYPGTGKTQVFEGVWN